MNNKNILFLLFILSFLLFFSSVASATDNINQSMEVTQYSSPIDNYGDDVDIKNIKNTEKNSKLIYLNSNNFDNYVTDGEFNENVTEGDTIDIENKLDGSRFAFNITKPVNIISSTGEGYVDFNTANSGEIFKISKEGTGTNISGITIHNTRLSLENTSNIKINNITFLDEGVAIGFGVGAVSIREGSENITISNSYFKTQGNGGHSNVVFAAAYNCLFENNTIEGYGDQGLIGNLLYLTTYNVQYATPATNINITIRNNTIRSYGTYGYGTCYGLVLEGTGHIIENNIIDTSIPVKAQYADKEYDFETYLGKIIFNNNTITHSDYNSHGSEGSPAELIFPGIVANNTFLNHGATLKQAYVYNNSFYTVTITNNAKFENNTAQKLRVTGNNNRLNNNEVYSNEDYAVTVTGENNTLENNKFASLNGRGENAINNSTVIYSINNSEDIPRIFYINDDNCDNYFDLYKEDNNGLWYMLKNDYFKNNDFIMLNTSKIYRLGGDYSPINLTLQIDKNSEHSNYFYLGISLNSTLINTYEPNMTVYSTMEPEIGTVPTKTLINCTVLSTPVSLNLINSEVLTPKNNILSDYPGMASPTSYLITKSTGLFKDEITSGSQLLLHMYDSGGVTRMYAKTINIDRSIGLTALPSFGRIESDVNLISGSEFSNFTGVTFDGNVVFNNNLNFVNCTFNKDVILNDVNTIDFRGCIFNGNISLLNSNLITFIDNEFNLEKMINVNTSRKVRFENNVITTNSDNTIVFDEESVNNEVRNNSLKAISLLGDDSVVGGDNIVEDNGASYNTSIEIVSDDSLFKNDVSNATVTVYNLLNNTPVDRGYVEVYLDGILQGIKPLVNGQVTLEVNTEKSSIGTVPLKVWYYEGIRYANNVSAINAEVVKSNVTITVDEFTAKLNEKATVTATFLNQNGNPVQATNVSFTVGRSTYNTETVNGVATIDELVTIEWLDAGKITVSFPATDSYNINTTTITLNTSKDDVVVTPVVSVEDSVASIQLNLLDSLNSPVSDGKITITTLDGHELASGRVTNGVYTTTVALPEDYSDEYLVANYTGSYYYNDFERNVKITQMLNSTITLETNSPLYGEDLIVTGTLRDSKNNPISDEEVTVNTDGTKTTYTTDANGTFTHTYTPVLGVNNITVTFNGNVDVYGTSAEKTVTVRDTDRDMNEVLNQLENITKTNEQLQNQIATQNEILNQLLEIINNLQQQNNNQTQIINELNDKLNNITQANEELSQQLNDSVNNLTEQNNDLQEQINNQTELINELTTTVDTVLTVDAIDDVYYGDSVVVTGRLTDSDGAVLGGSYIVVTINGNEFIVKTGANGVYTYTARADVVGVNNVSVNYEGRDKYNPSMAETTFTVSKLDTSIVLDSISSVKKDSEITVTGKLMDQNGKLLSGSVVKLLINNGRATVKTDASGVFTYNYKVSRIGTNNITASYLESAYYNPTSATTTVEVTQLNSIITIDDMGTVNKGSKATITGKLTDENDNVIANAQVKIIINGSSKTLKTDSEGRFTHTYTMSKVGENNITVTYAGSNNYMATNTTTTLEVAKGQAVITITPIDTVTQGDDAIITGTITDDIGNAVANAQVKVLINGSPKTIKADSNGVFTYTYTMKTVGINNITVTYAGSNTYLATETTTTFEVIKTE